MVVIDMPKGERYIDGNDVTPRTWRTLKRALKLLPAQLPENTRLKGINKSYLSDLGEDGLSALNRVGDKTVEEINEVISE